MQKRSFNFVKRIGPNRNVEANCVGCNACPDIWELDNGDFAVIGEDITFAAGQLPASAGCGEGERMVRIPRRLLVLAKSNIPDAP